MRTVAFLRMRKSVIASVAGFEVVFLGTFYAAHRLHPAGAALVGLAVVAVLPVVLVFGIFGRYLRDETDGFQRELAVRRVLWGTAGFLVVHLFLNFLRVFGWRGPPPPFCEFWAFALLALVAKFSYRAANRIPIEA